MASESVQMSLYIKILNSFDDLSHEHQKELAETAILACAQVLSDAAGEKDAIQFLWRTANSINGRRARDG